MLELSGISVSIGARPIIDALDLTLRAGELTVLAGPNGAGKSTLLKVMTGELAPDRGTVRLDGRPLAQFSPSALSRQRAVLPQSSALSFPFTVIEVVRLGLDRRPGLTADLRHRRAATALAKVGLTGFGGRHFQELSGGEQQRVHLARVLCQIGEPVEDGIARALFLDEPTTSLDIRHQVEVLRIARTFAAGGGMVFAILHDINLAAAFADRLAIMRGGRIAADGAPSAILTEPLLEEVFGIDLSVRHPSDGGPPIVMPRWRQD